MYAIPLAGRSSPGRTLLPSWPANRVLALAPKYWNETRQQPETQQRLASLRLLGRNDVSHAEDTTAAA
jgi:hypothetical protein